MMSVLSSSPRSMPNHFTEPFPVSLDLGAQPDENCLSSRLQLREPGEQATAVRPDTLCEPRYSLLRAASARTRETTASCTRFLDGCITLVELLLGKRVSC
jgi:hypothetical protein